MVRIILIFVCLFVLMLSVNGQRSDFAPRAGATEGVLPCGIKYYTLSTPWLRGKSSLGMVVCVGNLYETREEIGIAHFLEHLCSTSVPGFERNDVLEIVHQGGLDLFAEWQAFTSDTRTVYNYTYPKDDAKTEQAIVKYMRGVLAEMDFTDKEVENERSIILKEAKTSTTTVMSNLSGGYFENHSTVGDSCQICAITPEKVDSFYRKWYRPENIALVMIGDATEKELERKLYSFFGDAHCVVDSVLPYAVLPSNQSNTNLYNLKENGIGNSVRARLIFRYPLVDMIRIDNLRHGIALEMAGRMLKGILEMEKGFEVSSITPSNMPRASVTNVVMECVDTTDFRRKLSQVGNAVSYLRFGKMDETFLREIWQVSPSIYKIRVKNLQYGDSRTVLSDIYDRFVSHVPLADEYEYAQALDSVALTISEEDIHNAAEEMFVGVRGFLAGFPDYGNKFEERMNTYLDSVCACQPTSIALHLPKTRKFAPRYQDDRELLYQAPLDFQYEKTKKYVSANGFEIYRLANGMEIIWDKRDHQKRLLVQVECGLMALDSTDRECMRYFRKISTPLVADMSEEELEKSNRAWGIPRLGLTIEDYQTKLDMEWTALNEEYVWQYLSSIFIETGVDSYTYKNGTNKFVENIERQGKKVEVLSQDDIDKCINSILVPSKTKIYLQGNANIKQLLAYLDKIPVKSDCEMEEGKMVPITEYKVHYPEKQKGKTFLVNRICKENVTSISLKHYLIHNMLEEYMSRRIMFVIREELGWIYTWGTTPFFNRYPELHTSLSLRFRIVPDLLEASLKELEALCNEVTKKGIDEKQLEGLKRHEWNRYLNILNDPKRVMDFLATQMDLSDGLWSDKDIRRELKRITLQEVNEYFKRYMNLPAEVRIY